MCLIVNPIAGNRAFRSKQEIVDRLKEKVELTTLTTQKKGDASVFAQESRGFDLVVVAGGDGTFNEVINGLLLSKDPSEDRKDPPLALLPLGTSNVLARELAIPADLDEALLLALTGKAKKISLGRVNGRFFALMAGIGFDGECVLGVGGRTKRMFGRGAYIMSGVQRLFRYHPSLIQVRTAKETHTGYTVVVAKSRFYGGNFQVTPKAVITEPLLDLCLLKSRTRKRLMRFIAGVITDKHLSFYDVLYRRVSRVHITSRDTVHIQVDGDYFGTLPATIDAVEDAVSVVW